MSVKNSIVFTLNLRSRWSVTPSRTPSRQFFCPRAARCPRYSPLQLEMPRPPSSFKSDFSNCAEVTSPPQKKRRRKEEKNNTPSSSIDENVVRMFFSGSHCCCTQHIKLVASRVGYNFRMFGSVVDKRTRGLVV